VAGGPKRKASDPGHAVEADPDDPRWHIGMEVLELLTRLELAACRRPRRQAC